MAIYGVNYDVMVSEFTKALRGKTEDEAYDKVERLTIRFERANMKHELIVDAYKDGLKATGKEFR